MYQDKLDNRLVNAMLHQTFHYKELINTTSVGEFQSRVSKNTQKH